MSVLAIIPARSGSKGIPGKNFRLLAGIMPYERAIHAAINAGISSIVTSADVIPDRMLWTQPIKRPVTLHWRQRPPELAQDDTPMIAVVQHVLEQIPGPPDQKVILLQPTQPLRTPAHITQALELLTPEVDSVVSVVELPLTHSPDFLCVVEHDRLKPYPVWEGYEDVRHSFWQVPTRRQLADRVWLRDGTVYAFWRKTVKHSENIYGEKVVPLIIPASETQALDTPDDWAEAERRLRARAT